MPKPLDPGVRQARAREVAAMRRDNLTFWDIARRLDITYATAIQRLRLGCPDFGPLEDLRLIRRIDRIMAQPVYTDDHPWWKPDAITLELCRTIRGEMEAGR